MFNVSHSTCERRSRATVGGMDLGALLLATIPALASIGAAIAAGLFARRSRIAEAEAVRLRQLEERLSAKKIEMYEPLLQHLGDLLTKKPGAEQRSEAVMRDFMSLVVVYGSDEVLTAFSRFRAASAAAPPAPIILRLTADLFAAIRVDLAGTSRATGLELVGMRISDIYSPGGTLLGALRDPFEDVCARESWAPPWIVAAEPVSKRLK